MRAFLRDYCEAFEHEKAFWSLLRASRLSESVGGGSCLSDRTAKHPFCMSIASFSPLFPLLSGFFIAATSTTEWTRKAFLIPESTKRNLKSSKKQHERSLRHELEAFRCFLPLFSFRQLTFSSNIADYLCIFARNDFFPKAKWFTFRNFRGSRSPLRVGKLWVVFWVLLPLRA